jgi:hypothetical protein
MLTVHNLDICGILYDLFIHEINCFNNIITLKILQQAFKCRTLNLINCDKFMVTRWYRMPDCKLHTTRSASHNIELFSSFRNLLPPAISKNHENCTRHAPKCSCQLKMCRSTWWSVAMRFAPGSAGFVFSSGVGVNAKWRRVIIWSESSCIRPALNFLLLEQFFGYILTGLYTSIFKRNYCDVI